MAGKYEQETGADQGKKKASKKMSCSGTDMCYNHYNDSVIAFVKDKAQYAQRQKSVFDFWLLRYEVGNGDYEWGHGRQ